MNTHGPSSSLSCGSPQARAGHGDLLVQLCLCKICAVHTVWWVLFLREKCNIVPGRFGWLPRNDCGFGLRQSGDGSHGVAMTPADEEGCERDMGKQPGPRVPKADYTSLSASGNMRLWLDKYTRGWRKCHKVKKSQITVSSSCEHNTREQSLYLQEFVPTNPSSCTHCVMACKKPAPAKRVTQILWQY